MHVSVNVAVASTAPMDSLPEVAFEPDQPCEAVHAEAFVVLHVRVTSVPWATDVALAFNEIVGAPG